MCLFCEQSCVLILLCPEVIIIMPFSMRHENNSYFCEGTEKCTIKLNILVANRGPELYAHYILYVQLLSVCILILMQFCRYLIAVKMCLWTIRLWGSSTNAYNSSAPGASDFPPDSQRLPVWQEPTTSKQLGSKPNHNYSCIYTIYSFWYLVFQSFLAIIILCVVYLL